MSKNFFTNNVARISYLTKIKQSFLSVKIPFKFDEIWGKMDHQNILCLLKNRHDNIRIINPLNLKSFSASFIVLLGVMYGQTDGHTEYLATPFIEILRIYI